MGGGGGGGGDNERLCVMETHLRLKRFLAQATDHFVQ